MNFASILPKSVKQPLKAAMRLFRGLQYFGNGRHCPVCDTNSRKFGAAGIIPREDAQCMHCGAVERHRLVWLYFKRKTNLFSGQSLSMLHVAPEDFFEIRLRRFLGPNYLTADLHDPHAMVKMDIVDIQYPDESFDVIYCSHVLEHVANDKKAMREFFRVLKTGGWAILLVPIDTDKTFEDLSITDPLDRLEAFGDETHVRRYGPDYLDRLQDAQFDVRIIRPTDFLSGAEISEMGIQPSSGDIYYCTKRSQSLFDLTCV